MRRSLGTISEILVSEVNEIAMSLRLFGLLTEIGFRAVCRPVPHSDRWHTYTPFYHSAICADSRVVKRRILMPSLTVTTVTVPEREVSGHSESLYGRIPGRFNPMLLLPVIVPHYWLISSEKVNRNEQITEISEMVNGHLRGLWTSGLP